VTAVESPRDIVLLVDDSPDSLSFLTEALEATGYSVLIATSSASALSIADRIRPISFCSMPSCRAWVLQSCQRPMPLGTER